jgi:hypothetical protein
VPCSQDLIPTAVAYFLQNICEKINMKERERMRKIVMNRFKGVATGTHHGPALLSPGISHDKNMKCTQLIFWILTQITK